MRTTQHFAAGAVAWGALLGFPAASAAQSKVELVPFVGLYLPASNVIDQFNTACTCQVMVKHKTTVDVGARVAVWLSDRVGLEGSFGYAPSGVTATAAGFGSADTAARVITTSAQLRAALGPREANTSFYVSGGLGLVVRGGAAWTGTMGKTRVGGTVGIGARFKVTSSLALRAQAEEFLYSARFGSSGSTAPTTSKVQNDFVVSLGLAVPLGER